MNEVFANTGFAQFFFLFFGIMLFIAGKLQDFALSKRDDFNIKTWIRLNGIQTAISIFAAIGALLFLSENRVLSYGECIGLGFACDSAIKLFSKPILKKS